MDSLWRPGGVFSAVWRSIGVVELFLEVHRASIAECAVEPHTVAVSLDVVEEVGGDLGAGGVLRHTAERPPPSSASATHSPSLGGHAGLHDGVVAG